VSLWNLIVILLTFFLASSASGVGSFPYMANVNIKSPDTNPDSATFCPPPKASFDVSKFSQGKMYDPSKSKFDLEKFPEDKKAECKAFRDGFAKKTVFTYVFNVFMFLQLFNMINCRKVGISDTNVFENFFHNWTFIIILLICFFAQWALVNWFHDLVGAVLISRSEWGACLFIGATELLAAFALKFVPSKWIAFIPDISDFEDTAHKDPITDVYA
jgi:magnesium-transporting ATPase (P-type)